MFERTMPLPRIFMIGGWRGFFIKLGIVLLIMAYFAGVELRQESKTIQVPISRVPADVCLANGRIKYVTMHPTEPGVYFAHCQSGVTLMTPSVNGR